jgi:hypothetical protein
MMTWNSPLSVGFDILFGVFFTGIPLAALSAFGLYYALASVPALFTNGPKDPLGILAFSSIGLVGLIGSVSVIYVTFARGNTPAKPVFIAGLGIGILASLIAPVFFALNAEKFGTNLFSKLVIAAEIPIVIVAIKHVFMLTRGAL